MSGVTLSSNDAARPRILRTPTPIDPAEFAQILAQIAKIEQGLFPATSLRSLSDLVSFQQVPEFFPLDNASHGTVFMTVYRLVQLACQQRGVIPISLVLPDGICRVFTHVLGWRTLALSYGGEVDVPVELVPTRSLERTIVLFYAVQRNDENE